MQQFDANVTTLLVTIILAVLYFQVECSSTIKIKTCSSNKPWYFNVAFAKDFHV